VEGAGLSSGGHMARRVKMTDLAIFCRQLAISVNAGVTLRDSLESLGAEQENLTLKHAVMGIVEQIGNGKSFSESAAKYSRIFDSMFCGLIKVAEESGKLPQTLKQLASYMERADKLQRRVRAMSTYPMFIGIFFVLVCIAMTRFILPKFTAVFSGLGGELPLISKTVFSANQYILDHFWVILGMTAGIFSALILYARTSDGIRRKDRLVIALPLFGKSIKKYILARFCRSLAIMVQSGVPISTALEICAQATGNHHMKKAVMDARNMIMTGGLIASSFEKSGIFPALIIRMLSVGEESGQLPEVLENVADLYDDQVEVSIVTSMALFEPLVICIFGAFILVIVLAIYMPMFSMSSGMH
ncbi:MAG: type II secretion system F family protein, partial [Pontiellaceae bacterium]|nr:type II secretion system F family protein [Pontiellaceae bacterium]